MPNSGSGFVTTSNTRDEKNVQVKNEFAMWKEFTEKTAQNQSFSNCKCLIIMQPIFKIHILVIVIQNTLYTNDKASNQFQQKNLV